MDSAQESAVDTPSGVVEAATRAVLEGCFAASEIGERAGLGVFSLTGGDNAQWSGVDLELAPAHDRPPRGDRAAAIR